MNDHATARLEQAAQAVVDAHAELQAATTTAAMLERGDNLAAAIGALGDVLARRGVESLTP